MYYITGDTHGQYPDIRDRVKSNNLTKDDVLIVLGDFGANFYMTLRDNGFKGKCDRLGPTIFAIHGNHEARPETISSYKTKEWKGGIVYYEEDYPNILFAKDGEVYDFDGKSVFVCGGAYSVDKYYRAFRAALYGYATIPTEIFSKIEVLVNNGTLSSEDKKIVDKYLNKMPSDLLAWWKDEQPSAKTKKLCEKVLEDHNWKVDYIFTHTSPEKFEPTEMFLAGLNQENVDKKTERWFNKIENKLNYKKWYTGHYHTNKTVNDKFQFLYEEVQVLNTENEGSENENNEEDTKK